MATKLIITNYKNFKCGVKLNQGELVNIRFQTNEDVQIGDIYKVKIKEILPNDSGAFISYGQDDKRGFFKRINLPNGDKAHEGQSLLLQVRSIGSKDKVHLFTNNIILTGKFINLIPGLRALLFEIRLGVGPVISDQLLLRLEHRNGFGDGVW